MKHVCTWSFCLLFVLTSALQGFADPFVEHIKPLLESRCLSCHNSNNAKGDLSLTSKESALAFDAKIFSFDENNANLLLRVVSPSNGEPPEMPKKGKPFSAAEVERLASWIATGAEWPANIQLKEASKADSTWWAYQPLIPAHEQAFTAIDPFIDRQLASQGLKRNPPADRRTLIRRATYDLTGLPPTAEEVEAFVTDPDPQAYEQLIDRLLASPRYGERWGRHWLDVVRFGESNGFERNVIINDLWPFRDYVIESINNDKPFDQFIREHLAGDQLANGRPEIEIGTAFLVAGPYDDVGNQDAVQAAQIRANTLDEMIRATSEAFLGMTVGCARCHDHKFDPIAQADYYQLYATFAGIRHSSSPWATPQEKTTRAKKIQPLNEKKSQLDKQIEELEASILERAEANLAQFQAHWTRPKIERTGTEEIFPPVQTQFVRLISEGQDTNPNNTRNFNVDEFEIWSSSPTPTNVALASNGGSATGEARHIEDFADAYNADLAIDGEFGARFIATGGSLTIELAQPTLIDRIYFSSARGAQVATQGKFAFVGEYRIEISNDGKQWTTLTNSHDRQPVNNAFREHRLLKASINQEEQKQLSTLRRDRNRITQEINAIPRLATAFIGRKSESDAEGPFHLFQGGDPQRKGPEVVPASLSTLSQVTPTYTLPASSPEHHRRQALADWVTHPQNPLTLRVLANRLWHYHFGTGIVDTPSDFGYMGGRPSHPELLDFLAHALRSSDWRIKPLHRMIMLSETYQQSSTWRADGARADSDSRLLWRFPPRRLAAEEIRDTLLQVAGVLSHQGGGPGFRLYKFMQDNVCTYEPLDQHGPDTYRRAVYHQNARASVVDLMTDFDLPDCAFSTPRRADTTSPLQALTLLNHSFTVDMATALAERLKDHDTVDKQAETAFQRAFQRKPSSEEVAAATKLIESHGLRAFCRAILTANELIYVD